MGYPTEVRRATEILCRLKEVFGNPKRRTSAEFSRRIEDGALRHLESIHNVGYDHFLCAKDVRNLVLKAPSKPSPSQDALNLYGD